MDDNSSSKRRDSGGGGGNQAPSPSTDTAASMEPHSARRRAGALKRKANNSSLNNLSSAMFNSPQPSSSSKRFVREKAAIAALQPIHTGPCTRAAAASAWAAPAAMAAPDEPVVANVKVEDESKVNEEWKALEDAIETEYEVVRSRGAGVHVVPNHCGWFSWTKHHPLEEQALSYFFNGKSESRTPSIYMEIRNWIVNKFHSNPDKQIEIKDLEELSAGDLDARQEVMEFLDYWGLINFHPFPPTATDSPNVSTDGKESDKGTNLAEKLFRFETMQWCPPVVRKPNTPKPQTPKLLAEPTVPDEAMNPEGPSVEYHCNSCSTDCSRKRYHCQKQADFDLCSECFNNGKFGSDMASSDFILMEPAEAPGASSGTWTDQETLLLLEALELYKENWNEIAEHVATKTKDQCILHFVQMPIEDSFLDSDDESKEGHHESEDPGSNNNISSSPKDVPEAAEGKRGANEAQSLSCVEKSKAEDVSEDRVSQEVDENVALKALREAFEAVGTLPEPGSQLTFADAGNPVMAMAVFLARYVGSDAATASSRSSLKSLSGVSPNIELATRHCFILEDPPSDMKDSAGSVSMASNMGDRDAHNDDKMENVDPNEASVPAEVLTCRNLNKNESEEESSKASPSLNVHNKEKSDALVERDPSNGGTRENCSLTVKESSHVALKLSSLPGSVKKVNGVPTKAVDLVATTRKSDDPVEKTAKQEDPVKESAREEFSIVKGVKIQKDSVETTAMEEDSIKKHDKGVAIPSSVETSRVEVAGLVKQSDAVDENYLTQKNDPEVAGARESYGMKMRGQNVEESKEELTIDKLKRAAVTTLAAAAVKAKLLADQEEEEIKKLAAFLIDKQLRKLEIKMAFFDDMGSVTMRAKEQLDRSRQKLYQERAQIIAARLGLPASQPRPMPSSLPMNRNAINFANAGPRPPMGHNPLRPPVGGPVMPFAQPSVNQFPPNTLGRSNVRPQSQDKSSVRTK